MKKSEFKRGLSIQKALDIGNDSTFKNNERQKKFEEAVDIVTKTISNDAGFAYSYQANIAMCQVDAESNYRKKTGKTYLNYNDRLIIANQGATDFLRLWTRNKYLPVMNWFECDDK